MKSITRLPILLVAALALMNATAAHARTIVLTDEDCEHLAAISSDAPHMSWAATINGNGEFSNHVIDLTQKQSFLMRYPLDRIPAGQKITKAEWIVPFLQVYPPGGVRVQARRLLKDWGPGVSYEDRMTRPKREKWHTPGAKGLGQDRAARPTAMLTFKMSGEMSFNVTEDVELWYSGAAKNYGWILSAEDQDAWVRTPSPFWGAPKGWKLKITYEPE